MTYLNKLVAISIQTVTISILHQFLSQIIANTILKVRIAQYEPNSWGKAEV